MKQLKAFKHSTLDDCAIRFTIQVQILLPLHKKWYKLPFQEKVLKENLFYNALYDL